MNRNECEFYYPKLSKDEEINITQSLRESLEQLNKKIIVLDDDPTGIQTVHNVSVYTDWEKSSIRSGFREKNNVFFILTNSRGLTSIESKKLHTEIAENIEKISTDENKEYIIISRSDSTLRGHYSMETSTLRNVIENISDKKFDGEIICPFFEEGSRLTIGNVHYLQDKNGFVQIGKTEFAKDKTFGFVSSHLGEWIEEKTKGNFRKEDITYISLESLRNLEVNKIKNNLMNVKDFNKIVVNAIDYLDLKIFTLALIQAILEGKNYMLRSAASIVKVLGNISGKELLTREDLIKNNSKGGIIVVGSYTRKTTNQLNELRKISSIKFIEFNTDLVKNKFMFKEEINRVVLECEKSIKKGVTVVVYTKREALKLENHDKDFTLKVSIEISNGVVSIVEGIITKSSFIIAKGGITSSEIGTKALKVKKANVMGQIKPGIPVWETDKQSKFSTIPYIIFPGNVGEDTTLKDIVKLLV